jgi:hypothetical protein
MSSSVARLLVALQMVPVSAQHCQAEESKRVDCHHGEGDCQTAGCCWQPVSPNPNNVPWCFVDPVGPSPTPPPSPQCANITVDERVDCSKGSETDCQAAGCCWSPVSPNPDNRPWCYFSDQKVKPCSLAFEPQLPFSQSDLQEVRTYFEANLDIQGSGMVVAAPDHNTGPGGDYYYAWMRDGALSMNAYMATAATFEDTEQKMDSWLAWVERGQNQFSGYSKIITWRFSHVTLQQRFVATPNASSNIQHSPNPLHTT